MAIRQIEAGRGVTEDIDVVIEIPINKNLEKAKWVQIEGWHGPQDARRCILEGGECHTKPAGKDA